MDVPAASAYANGKDAIDVAVERVAMMLDVRDEVVKGREKDPDSFPIFGSIDRPVIARRIVASLLNAGWRPPA
jgi:hypothetical protein